jgi:hypothetical protein
MCTCNNCNEITLFKGTNGVGVSSTIDNNDGTFTIYYTDGTSFTSEDLTGPTGETGATGATGAAGINAFKFVKDFETNDDGGTITTSRVDLESCFNVPNGCLFDDVAAGFTNLHVQIWIRLNDPTPSGNWFLGDSTNTNITINPSTGAITCTFTGGGTNILARMVVIG